jgi:hypothetical protein
MSWLSVLGKGLRSVPILGTAIGMADMAADIGKTVGGVLKKLPKKMPASQLPNLPAVRSMPGLPVGRGMGAGARVGSMVGRGLNVAGALGSTVYLGDMAINAVTHGKRNGMQSSMLPQTVDESQLRTYYRAPKGYVVVKDTVSGKVIGVRKADAKALGLWRPKPKPPISVRDWHAYKSAIKVEKKIKKVFHHSFTAKRKSYGGSHAVHHKSKCK